MKKRIITGAVYVLVLIGLLALKWLVPGGWGSFGFDALFCAISVIGSLELLKALNVVSFPQRTVTVAFCAVIVPLFALTEATTGSGYLAAAICIVVYVIAICVLLAAHSGGSDKNSTLSSLFTMAYCGILCCALSAVNHLPRYSVAAVLLMFFIVMITDSAAYIIGSIFKRWLPYKLAPEISPNKTIVGGIGGLIGGMAAAVAAFYIYYGLSLVIGTPQISVPGLPPVVFFLLTGLLGAIFGQAGDLFESAIKRKCGVKDTGKLLPGHGGVLDRFDSLLFCGVIILLCFGILAI